MKIETIRLYPKEELIAAWARDKKHFHPDAETPPRCLRCGRPLDRHFPVNAFSRALDVYICEACGTAEGLGDWAGKTTPLREWHAVRSGRLPAMESPGTVILKPSCPFQHIFHGPQKQVSGYGGQRPVSEVAFSRSDYDGRRWWTTWHRMQEEQAPTEQAQEMDSIMDALLEMSEFQNLWALQRTCTLYGEPTDEPTEFNLYGESPSFYLWLQLITRERDYNMYVHFYEKSS